MCNTQEGAEDDDLPTSFGMSACNATCTFDFLYEPLPNACSCHTMQIGLLCVFVVLVHLLFVVATRLLCISMLPVV